MPVYGNNAYGERGYGDVAGITAPTLITVADAFGDNAFGSVAYGGDSLDNSGNRLRGVPLEASPTVLGDVLSGNTLNGTVNVPIPVVTGAITDIIQSPVAKSYGDTGTNAYGGGSVAVLQIATNITEPAAVVAATMITTAAGASVTEPLPQVSVTLLNGSSTSPAITEPSPTVSATTAPELQVSADITEPAPLVSSNAVNTPVYPSNATAQEPAPTQSGTALNTPALWANITETAPIVFALAFPAYGVTVNITEPDASISAVVGYGDVAQGNATEPSVSFSGTINDRSGNAIEPDAVITAAIQTGATMSVSVAEQKPTGVGTGFGEQVQSVAVKELKPSVSANMAGGAYADAIITEQSARVSSTTVLGAVVTGNVIDIVPVINAQLLIEGLITGSVTEANATSVGTVSNIASVVITATDVTAYAINTETMAASEYTNYQFKGLSVVGGKLYGIRDDGIYLLEGADDNGMAIDSEILTGQTDLDQDRLKRVPLIHGDVSGDIDILLEEDGVLHQIPFNGRAKPGRGLRGNVLAFGVKNKNGSKMTIQSIEPTIEILKKRAL